MHRRDLMAALAAFGLSGLRAARSAPIKAAPMPAPGGTTVSTDRFSVVTQGSGPDVIFVPGLTCGRDVWDQVVAHLGGGYRVHLVQVDGFDGDPPRGNAQGPICAGVADGLAAYIAKAGLHKPAYVGHSMGGSIGLMLAARHPHALGRLMVVDMFPALATVMLPPGATPQQIHAAAAAIGGGMAHADEAGYRKRLDANLHSMILTDAGRPQIEREGLASDHAVAGRAMQELIETDLTPELAKITVPTTVLYAWNTSNPYSQAQADALFHSVYASLAGVKLVRVDGSAHFIFIDQPARFDAALHTFLTA